MAGKHPSNASKRGDETASVRSVSHLRRPSACTIQHILKLKLARAANFLPAPSALMTHTDLTLTSPLSDIAQASPALLGLTIAWHPELDRVGEQFIGTCSEGVLEVSRFLPIFAKPGKSGLALGHGGISRDPLQIVRGRDDSIDIRLPHSRMVVEVNGEEIHTSASLTREQIDAGVVLGLGRTVLICLHWMRCLPKNNPVAGFLGVGHGAIKTRDLIRQAAATESAVLLLGETGTGKEVAASAIHAMGRRAAAAFVCVNMAALNESLAAADLFGAAKGAYTGAHAARNGLFAEAQNATLFLDEIGNTPASVQPMLLRVLENGEYRPLGATRDQHSSARLIAATDQDLYGDSFNQALLRRLESFLIHIPPLRARREDIGLLMVNLLRNASVAGAASVTLPASLVSHFINYDWPGNVRQLSHVLKRMLLAMENGEVPVFDSLVNVVSLRVTNSGTPIVAAAPRTNAPPTRKKLADISEEDVMQAMEHSHWTIQGAAEELGISRPSMYKLLDAHSQIRHAEAIPSEEIRQTLAASAGDLERCASALKTPYEALRRHLRGVV